MRPLDLKEFAEELRRKGDWREAEFADEILQLLDIEEECAEPFSNLCVDIAEYAKDYDYPDNAPKALEWVGDRSNLLGEIEDELEKDGRTGDVDDQVKAMLETLATIRNILQLPDEATDEDMETAVQALVEAAPTPENCDACNGRGRDLEGSRCQVCGGAGTLPEKQKPAMEYDL